MKIDSANDCAILGIGTAVPANRLVQADVALRMADALGGNTQPARWARRIFRTCGVETRYTSEPDLLSPADQCRYVPGLHEEREVPRTSERMRKYESAAVPLALTAARRALDDGRLRRRDVTHLITVSCTGMFLPGLDYALTRELGLNPDVIRVPLQFLGCAAGMTAIRMAAQMVKADERACVLVVCVELCTLHIQPSGERESLYASAFFGDGASACVIGNPGNDHQAYFKLGEGKAILIPDTAEEMRWTIGDYGFDLFLSPQIPGHIGRIIHSALESYWDSGMPPQFWAIHPGGRGIVDAVQDALELTEAETAASRSVLRQFGNMSSATILFVLDEIRRQLAGNGLDQRPAEGVAIAFGPGMHAEIMRMTAYPAVRHAARMEQEVKHV